MMLVRRGDVDYFDGAVGAEILDRGIRPRTKVCAKVPGRLAARVRRGDQFDARIAGKRWQHQCERAPQTGDSDAQTTLAHDKSPACTLLLLAFVF
jgi:hypothetical protein